MVSGFLGSATLEPMAWGFRLVKWHCTAVSLGCGTNTQSILDDPDYIGIRQKRSKVGTAEHQKYMDFVDEFVFAVKERFGKNTMIQWEDFGNKNAFVLLKKYQKTIASFNDDIQGSAAAALAGFYASSAITGMQLHQHSVLIAGAGEAGAGTAELLANAMANEAKDLTVEQARQRIK